MRKTIAVASTAGALLFGVPAIAHAETSHAGVPASMTTTLAQDDYGTNNDKDNTGLWGLAGLLGLLGLLGLRHRHDTPDRRNGTAALGTTRSYGGPTPSARTTGSHTSDSGAIPSAPGSSAPSTYGTSMGTSGTSGVAPTTPHSTPTTPPTP